jgi:predicted MPP superfamily phosphohydrolase
MNDRRPAEGHAGGTARAATGARDALARARAAWSGSAAAVAVLALLGGWLALLAVGSTTQPVGPVEARLSLRPALTGDTVVQIPPLGSLQLDTHDGPLRLQAEVVQVDAAKARDLLRDPAALNQLADTAVVDLRAGMARLLARALAVAVAGAGLACLVVLRRPRAAAAGAGLTAGALVAAGIGAAATFDARAISSPRYDGLLAIAPNVVGDAEDIVSNISAYGEQLAQIVTNVSRLYAVTLALPALSPDPTTVRVLLVSDLHLNPAAFDVIRSVTEQFQTDLVIDAGDLTDRGSAPEDRFAERIATLGQPYVFVRGNHDSLGTERAVEAQPNAVVLRDGEVTEQHGVRIIGAGDPRFTPDKSTRDREPPPTVEQAGNRLAEQVRAETATGRRVDIAVVHDPAMGLPLDGTVPLVVSGHGHAREVRLLEQGTRMFEQGSTGGAGLRGLEGEQPTPVQLSVLYLDRTSGALQAWDDITLGGLGLASAQIERHLAEEALPPDARPAFPPPG